MQYRCGFVSEGGAALWIFAGLVEGQNVMDNLRDPSQRCPFASSHDLRCRSPPFLSCLSLAISMHHHFLAIPSNLGFALLLHLPRPKSS